MAEPRTVYKKEQYLYLVSLYYARKVTNVIGASISHWSRVFFLFLTKSKMKISTDHLLIMCHASRLLSVQMSCD